MSHHLFQSSFCPKFNWLIWCIDCLTNALFFNIPLLYYHINTKIINNFLSFFWRYVSFQCFFIILICDCFWIILLLIFWNFCYFFNIPSLLYSTFSSWIISCLSSGNTYLSLGISLSCSFVTVSELFCCEFSENLLILLAVLLPIKH